MSELNKGFMIINGQIIGATGEKVYSTSPIGTVLSYAGQTAPNGYLLCNGASYLVKDYPDLYAVIGNTYGGDSTNFNVPNLIDKFIQGSNTSGTEKEAGLPNITGSFMPWAYKSSLTPTGAFGQTGTTSHSYNISDNNSGSSVTFDASKSNPIYGNSDTVQPPALTMVYIIKAFHTNEGTDVEVELSDTVINKISQKATEIINDNTVNPKSVWSSQKLNDELEDVRNELDIIVEEANKSTSINDSVISQTTVWSSKYTSEKIAGVIDDTKSSGDTATTWSSKKTSGELAQKLNANNNVSMVGLGFTKGDTVHVSDFLGALVAKFGRNGYCNMLYANASSATVVNSAGTQSVLINGGVLYFSATNEKFPNDTWSYAEAIYYPIEGIQGKMYKLFARTAGEAGTVSNSGIYQYSSDIEIINDTVSDSTSTYSSAKIDEKIAKHPLPIAFDSGIINNSTVQVYKLANVGYTASGGTDAYNLNLLLSSRGAEEIELIGGKNDGSWIIEAIRNNKSFNKITNIYQDGLDIYVRLDLRCNYFRVYHKSGALSGDFAVSLVDTIPATATELIVTEYATKADLGSNVPMKEIAFTNSTNWSNSSGNLKTFYMVKNGWCFLHVVAHCNKVANDDNSVVYSGLPIPPFQVYGKFVGEDNTYEPCNLTIATNGQMLLRGGTAGKDYSFTYTYPVV